MMKQIKFLVVLTIMLLFPENAFSAESRNTSKENVIAQMNYCITSLTNIIHNKSMMVLEHETDQLLNNLTIEQIVGLYEINDFRIDLLDALSKFNITEQERQLLKRIQSIQRDNMKWAALSNALDPTMLLTGNGQGMGPQLAFQALLTAARSAVEYKTMQGEQNISELQAMWDLRKEELKEINEIRKQALQLVFELYSKFNLNEGDRLTESTANNFSLYISEDNPNKRARLLEDNRAVYQNIADYYYYLGMAYLDLSNYNKAKSNFETYLSKYSKAPLLRHDEKSGCIALAILANEPSMSLEDKQKYINMALTNMPNNSAAVLQCALIYAYDFHNPSQALKLIRAGIENPKASDPSVLFMAAANLYPYAKNLPDLSIEISSLFSLNPAISLDSYVTYLINSQKNPWEKIQELIVSQNCYYRKWYFLWIGRFFNTGFHIILPENILFNRNDITAYYEKVNSKEVEVCQLDFEYINGTSANKFDKVDCFKSNPDLKYLYFDVLEPDKSFLLKKDIDYNRIKTEDPEKQWPGQDDFILSADDIDDIIEFCKDNTPENRDNALKFKRVKAEGKVVGDICGKKVIFKGDATHYQTNELKLQDGEYVRLVLANGVYLLYYFDENEAKLLPFSYFYDNKVIFANPEKQKEYQNQNSNLASQNDDNKTEEPSGCSRFWKSVGDWFSNLWSSLTNLFSKDDDDKKSDDQVIKNDIPLEPQKVGSKNASHIGNKEESSNKESTDTIWYKKLWYSTKEAVSDFF